MPSPPTAKKRPSRARKAPRAPRAPRVRPPYFLSAAELEAIGADDPAREFAESVFKNPYAHCRWVHLSVRRHCADMQFAARDPAWPYVFDAASAQRPVAFAAQFRGIQGPLAGQPLHLLPWQRFLVSQLYGWRLREQPARRRFSYAYIEVPRKNGKSGFVAPLALYQLSHTGGARAEVYSVATKLDQAKIVWKDAVRLAKTSRAWAPFFRSRYNDLTHLSSDSEFRPLGADHSTLDGLRPELAIMDEIHAWPRRELWDVINSAFGAAFSPLILQITTAGENAEGIAMEQRTRLEKVLQSVARGTYRGREGDQATYAGGIWTIDKGDKWDSPAAWAKANPSLGTVKNVQEMEKLAQGARASDGARRDFLIKQLNAWQTTGPARWLDPEQWARGHDPAGQLAPSAEQAWERLRGLDVYCGMDLAATVDTSSFCAVAVDPRDPKRLLAAWRFWVPANNLSARCARDGVPYDSWAREGWLHLSEGDVTDGNRVEADIVETIRSYGLRVKSFAYDAAWSQGVGQRLQDNHQLPMYQCPQRYTTMTAPINEVERLVLAQRLRHAANPIAAAHAATVTLITGGAGGRMLAKGRSTGRIDGMAALVMAVAAQLNEQEKPQRGFGLYFAPWAPTQPAQSSEKPA